MQDFTACKMGGWAISTLSAAVWDKVGQVEITDLFLKTVTLFNDYQTWSSQGFLYKKTVN